MFQEGKNIVKENYIRKITESLTEGQRVENGSFCTSKFLQAGSSCKHIAFCEKG
jgi:hypothetical protein